MTNEPGSGADLGRFDVWVSDPNGRRAAVPHPVFPSAIPVGHVKLVDDRHTSSKAVRLTIDCGDRPDAAAFIHSAATGSARFSVCIEMRRHDSGNGYIVLRISSDAGPEGPGRRDRGEVEVVLDPELDAATIEAVASSGRLVLVPVTPRARSVTGLLLSVDADVLRATAEQAGVQASPKRFRVTTTWPCPS